MLLLWSDQGTQEEIALVGPKARNDWVLFFFLLGKKVSTGAL